MQLSGERVSCGNVPQKEHKRTDICPTHTMDLIIDELFTGVD